MNLWKQWHKKEQLRKQLESITNDLSNINSIINDIKPQWLFDLNTWKNAILKIKYWKKILSIKDIYIQWQNGISENIIANWKHNEKLLLSINKEIRKIKKIQYIYCIKKHQVLCDLRGMELKSFESQDIRILKEHELKQYHNTISDLHKEYGSINNTISQIKQNRKKIDILSLYLKTLSTTTTSMKYLSKELDKYQATLYENIVIPSIISKMNNHLSKLTTSGIQLLGYTNGTKLDWRVNKENREVRIWKCSGYEKQILSLSIREVLQDIMGCELGGIMLIDEAFVGSDDINIHKVGDYLRWLVRRRGRIMIVSHMEKIKSECDVTINILYENGLSTLK
jgi:DNA repair exonuclease SbcCD ATPase subunit